MRVQVLAQRGLHVLPIGAHHKAQLAVRHRLRGDGVDGPLRVARAQRQQFQRVPAHQLLGGGEAGLAPAGGERGVIGSGANHHVLEGSAQLVGHRRRQQAFDQDAALRVHQRGQCVREHRGRVGQHAAPVARVIRLVAAAHGEREIDRTARPQKEGGVARIHTGAVAGHEQVGLQCIAVLLTEGAQAGRACLFAHLHEQRHVVAQTAAPGLDGVGQCGQAHGVLAFVVGRASAIPALAFYGQLPGREALAPLRVLPVDHVAVAVGEHGGQRRVFHTACHQKGAALRRGVVEHLACKTQRREPGHHFVGEVGAQFGRHLAGVAFGAPGHTAAQVGGKAALVKVALDVLNELLAVHRAAPVPVFVNPPRSWRGGPARGSGRSRHRSWRAWPRGPGARVPCPGCASVPAGHCRG